MPARQLAPARENFRRDGLGGEDTDEVLLAQAAILQEGAKKFNSMHVGNFKRGVLPVGEQIAEKIDVGFLSIRQIRLGKKVLNAALGCAPLSFSPDFHWRKLLHQLHIRLAIKTKDRSSRHLRRTPHESSPVGQTAFASDSRAAIAEQRGDLTDYEFVMGGRSRYADPGAEREWLTATADAGATWWTEWVKPAPADEMRDNVARGPLHVE